MTTRNLAQTLAAYPTVASEQVDTLFEKAFAQLSHKIIVLDDDPTGVQTVHGVSVYTDWSEDSIRAGFAEDNRLFFILTNSRAFTAQETATVHTEIAERVEAI